jgi:hypothetical protein
MLLAHAMYAHTWPGPLTPGPAHSHLARPASLQDLTARAKDSLVSFGERMSTRIFASYLRTLVSGLGQGCCGAGGCGSRLAWLDTSDQSVPQNVTRTVWHMNAWWQHATAWHAAAMRHRTMAT